MPLLWYSPYGNTSYAGGNLICLVYGILNIFRMIFIILYIFTVNNLSVYLCMAKYKNSPIWMLLGIPMFWAAKYESEIRS